jgi:DNA invertase Pin-like site-specific DNA recombinase
MARKNLQKAVAYYRVSTVKQGQSGLGLDAQRASVKQFARSNDLEIAAEYTEIETGTRKKRRPQLEAAMVEARALDALLLIAKLDRLARNVHFISGLIESGVRFKAVDMPEADNLTIHILAAVAEKEAQMISQRTKAALDAKLARDGEWRVSGLSDSARRAGANTNRGNAVKAYQTVAFTAKLLRDSGLSYDHVAKRLNANGFRTRRGRPFHAMTVKRMLDRGM